MDASTLSFRDASSSARSFPFLSMSAERQDLFFSLALTALPRPMITPLCRIIVARLEHRIPGLKERLRPLDGKTVFIQPKDLTVGFLLSISNGHPHLTAISPESLPKKTEMDARLEASLEVFFHLLHGESDGDALFFSRDLKVDGDMSVVVALRNAMDGLGEDLLKDVFTLPQPFRSLFNRAGGVANRCVDRIIDPFLKKTAKLENRLSKIQAEIDALHQKEEGSPLKSVHNSIEKDQENNADLRGTAKNAIELLAPAGTPAALRSAIDAGANAVYLGFRDETNARNYPGLNFTREDLKEGIAYAHQRGRRVHVAINTYAAAGHMDSWYKAIDTAAELGADALIMADMGLLSYASQHYPDLSRHLSVQAGASTPAAIQFYYEMFGINRMVLPRMFTLDEIAALKEKVPIEIETFIFGSLSPMSEGRCALSAYATGRSPNLCGVCSPAEHVRYKNEDGVLISQLGDFVINRFGKDEAAGYPTLCKGRYIPKGGEASYLFEKPECLNAAEYIASLRAAGVTSFKIEGRQRSRFYTTEVVSCFRALLDAEASGKSADSLPDVLNRLRDLAEGGEETRGAYRKGWR
ncbi:ubiquinone anaerobic biosynthesis protein UbiU [Zymomonas mobilis]|uniref:ubiquinone anaerobic biosynthesis protein UbiU n=1 Tax=Zymomonas mobilis TaxID=542 RepID=UPI0039E7F62D